MKKILLTVICTLCAMVVVAQNDYDTETGIRLYKNENYQAALPYFQRAAKNGSLAALDFLGYMYERGKGVEKNYAIALNLYKKGEARNYAPCLTNIGRLYREGHGVTQNLNTAYTYFMKAAEQNNSDGEYWVYNAKQLGEGTEKDLSGALAYAERAANHGEKWLYTNIGDMYYDGVGTDINKKKAYEWYAKGDGKYDNPTKLRVAEILYSGAVVVSGSPMQQSLAILEKLVAAGYEDARSLHNIVKAEYEKQVEAGNKVTPPRMTDAVKTYLSNYRRPGAPAIESAGHGEIRITFTVTSSGSISNAVYKKRVLVSMDEAAMRMINGMPNWIPGTKGGHNTNMKVTLGISWYPSKEIRMLSYSSN
ncbi:SEL1-like repeat protein [Bacteroides helcogenes]|uniref:Sel1 domain protein repeat-containing protein n=1 Tax=Bacteroides helcogenes (strain ATCC 35417 / DSM 20613 / JCM 6297 / CCUG 15421 / P 36-108) TaxID=693979 RepID=E6SMT7_BACT6|nr:SEL1-like repeat protein [Bacteroides helcogenes]ADV42653.1 Sel1 domain protein repeat-containing protein [Bacteroides helcogenes P 36-108]MDY5239483.1 SEL1-like repeat protein [Bacteroides helcogenes]